jgi:hypothetical protein
LIAAYSRHSNPEFAAVTNFLVIEHEVDELRDLDVVDGDLELVPRGDD